MFWLWESNICLAPKKMAQQRGGKIRKRGQGQGQVMRERKENGGPAPQGLAIRRKEQKDRGAREELKFFDTMVDTGFLAQTDTVIVPSSNLITQGTGASQIVGRSVTVKSITISMQVKLRENQGAIGTGVGDLEYRICLCLDRNSNGIEFKDIAQMYQTPIGEPNNLRAFLNLANTSKYKVVKQFRGTLNASLTIGHPADTYISHKMVAHHEHWLKQDQKLTFLDAPGVDPRPIGTVTGANYFWVAFISDAQRIQIKLNTRFRYTDS